MWCPVSLGIAVDRSIPSNLKALDLTRWHGVLWMDWWFCGCGRLNFQWWKTTMVISLSLSLRNKHGRLYVLILFNLPCLHDRGMHIFIGRWCHLCILPYSSVSRTARWISVEYSGVGSLTRKPPQGCYIRFLMNFLLIPWMSWQFSS